MILLIKDQRIVNLLLVGFSNFWEVGLSNPAPPLSHYRDILAENGLDVNAKGEDELTALHIAV